jgi:hypothetical protein
MIAFTGPTRKFHPFANGKFGMGLIDTYTEPYSESLVR